jgi:glycosyl transferase family 25
MKLVVINLEKSVDRLKAITENLNNLDLPFERFNAIYGRDLTEKEIEANTTSACNGLLCNYGIIGCAMSHIAIWKLFAKSSDNLICIAEDDAIFTDEFPDFVENINKVYSKLKFDILSLFGETGITSSLSEQIKIDNYIFCKPIFPLSMTCYILSKKGVNKLLQEFEKIQYNIDFMIAFKNLFSNTFEYYYLESHKIISHNFNESTINTTSNSILNNILAGGGFKKLNWFLNLPIFTINLKFTVTLYMLILIISIAISVYFKKYYITSVLLFEFILLNI